MNKDRIIVVCGLGRCGTSMMMKMLHFGGVLPWCPATKIGGSYESMDMFRLPDDWEWLEDVRGKAIKVLDPHKWRLPKQLPYDIILMRRNEREQAKSQVKFLRDVGSNAQKNRQAVRRLVRKNENDLVSIRTMFAGYPDARVLEVSYEDVLSDPAMEGVRTAMHLGLDDPGIKAAHMAFQVHERGAACLPHMAEHYMTGHSA